MCKLNFLILLQIVIWTLYNYYFSILFQGSTYVRSKEMVVCKSNSKFFAPFVSNAPIGNGELGKTTLFYIIFTCGTQVLKRGWLHPPHPPTPPPPVKNILRFFAKLDSPRKQSVISRCVFSKTLVLNVQFDKLAYFPAKTFLTVCLLGPSTHPPK